MVLFNMCSHDESIMVQRSFLEVELSCQHNDFMFPKFLNEMFNEINEIDENDENGEKEINVKTNRKVFRREYRTNTDDRRVLRHQFHTNTDNEASSVKTSSLKTSSVESKHIKTNDSAELPKEGIELRNSSMESTSTFYTQKFSQSLNRLREHFKERTSNKCKKLLHKYESSVRIAQMLELSKDQTKEQLSSHNIHKSSNDSVVHNQQIETEHSVIVETPVLRKSQRKIGRGIDRSRIIPRRLFAEDDNHGCALKNCITTSSTPFSLFTFPYIPSNQNLNLVLSGNIRKPQPKSHPENRNTAYSSERPTSHPISEKLTSCHTSDASDKNRNENSYRGRDSDIYKFQDMHTIDTLMSMEMTEIYDYMRLSKGKSPEQSKFFNISSKDLKEKETEIKTTEKTINAASFILDKYTQLIQGKGLQQSKFFNISSKDLKEKETEIKATERTKNVVPTILDEYTQPIQGESLQQSRYFNTSITNLKEKETEIKTTERTKSIFMSRFENVESLDKDTVWNSSTRLYASYANIRKNVDEYNRRTVINSRNIEAMPREKLIVDNQDKSTNSIYSSLYVNTSLDSMRGACPRNIRNKEPIKNNREDLPNHFTSQMSSLCFPSAERSKYLNYQTQFSFREKDIMCRALSEIYKLQLFNAPTMYLPAPGTLLDNLCMLKECQFDQLENFKTTLYDMLLEEKHRRFDTDIETELKYVRIFSYLQNKNKNYDRLYPSSSLSVSREANASNRTSNMMKDNTVSLGSTLNCNPFVTQEKAGIIKDTLNKMECEIDQENTATSQNAKYVKMKKHKRRLLSLNNNSQLYSITPVEEHNEILVKTKEIKKKMQSKKKLANPKKDTNDMECNNLNEQIHSAKDCNIAENEKGIRKKTQKPRKFINKTVTIKQHNNKNMLKISEESEQKEKDLLIANRNSLNDFVTCPRIPNQLNNQDSDKIVIVMTGFSEKTKDLTKTIAQLLGMARVEKNVTKRTTHVICPAGIRTANVYRGIIRGCWIVPTEWLFHSWEQKKWLNPERYEMKYLCKAVEENRKDRQLFGQAYFPELFSTCGYIHVSEKKVSYNLIEEFIELAGGLITENPKQAKIIIGTNGLTEKWVFHCISRGEIQPLELYQTK